MLTRVQLIAELTIIAPQHASDLKLALEMIIDLSNGVLRTKTTIGFFITLTDKQEFAHPVSVNVYAA